MAPLYKRLVSRRKTAKCAVMMGLTTVLSACGGEEGGGSTTTPPPPAPVNRAPIVTLSDVPTEIREAEALNFRFSGSDPEGDALTYTLATTAGPDLNLSVSGLNGMGTAPSVDSDMTATIQVTANDGRLSTTATADILIVNNAAPNAVLTTDTASVREGATVSLDASSSSDAEDDSLTYSYVVIAGPDIDLTGQTGPMTSFTARNTQHHDFQQYCTCGESDGDTRGCR